MGDRRGDKLRKIVRPWHPFLGLRFHRPVFRNQNLLTEPIMPNIKARREAGRTRDLAIIMVDGPKRYTMEFSSNPEAHAAEYDEMEQLLTKSMAHIGVKLART